MGVPFSGEAVHADLESTMDEDTKKDRWLEGGGGNG
jgi:hypothetical protein